MKLSVWVPCYGEPACMATGALLQAAMGSKRIQTITFDQKGNSLLAFTFNTAWANARNGAEDGIFTHFLMLHKDVCPRNMPPGTMDWFDKFAGEMEKTNADVLSAIIAIKDERGLTSTALDTDYWGPQRITVKQANEQLPVTWTTDTLLFNTGMMLIDLRKPWIHETHFTINDRIVRVNGKWMAQTEPEDWNFSRQCKRLGVRYFVTRVVPVDHYGIGGYCSDQVWGMPSDGQCAAPSGKILIADANNELTLFEPIRIKEIN